MAVSKLDVIEQYFDNDGLLAAGCKLYTYAAGTSTLLATYTDVTGTIPNTNPIVGDSSARVQTWFTVGLAYRVYITDENDAELDDIDGIVIPSGSGSTTITTSVGYPLSFEFLGGIVPRTVETIGIENFAQDITFPANWSGAQGSCEVAPTAEFTISVKRNGAEVGTVVFAAGAYTPTFHTIASAEVPFLDGDKMTLIAPVTPDATIADIGLKLQGAAA